MPHAASLPYVVRGEGPPAVLVPGLGLDRWFWHPLWRRLPGLRLHAVDLPRFRTTRGFASVAEVAAMLAAWHAEAGLPPCPWLGHSLGGQVCAHLAAEHPHCVTALILLAPSVPASYSGYRLSELALEILREPPSLWWQIVRGILAHGLGEPVRAIAGAAADAGFWDTLGKIDVPTMVAYGERDGFIPAHRLPAVARAISGARLRVIPEAQHTIVYTHADGLAEAVDEFLQVHAARAAAEVAIPVP